MMEVEVKHWIRTNFKMKILEIIFDDSVKYLKKLKKFQN